MAERREADAREQRGELQPLRFGEFTLFMRRTDGNYLRIGIWAANRVRGVFETGEIIRSYAGIRRLKSSPSRSSERPGSAFSPRIRRNSPAVGNICYTVRKAKTAGW